MHLTTLLTAVVPLAALISTTPINAAHSPADASRRHISHKGAAQHAARVEQASETEQLYREAAYNAAHGTKKKRSAPPPRKRKTCSASVSSDGSSLVAAASSAIAGGASSAPASAGSSASSVVNVGAAVSTGAASSSAFSNPLTASTRSGSSAWATSSGTASLTPTSTSSSAAPAATSSKYDSQWKLDLVANGTSFFDSWTFWNYDDPTHGTVSYQDSATSWNEGLVSINSAGHAIMTVDQTQAVTGGRKSVRLHSTYIFNGGLILMDSHHMPWGCGVWPAWWSNGPNWPAGGEIDILEGVNGFTHNQVSIHTSPGCTLPTNLDMTSSLTTGSYNSYDCSSANTDNQGCGERDSTTANAYGPDFNSNGGGVYAMKWDTTGIKVYFFPREAIPDDITADEPMPDTWGTPMGDFPSDNCDPYTFFSDNFAIFDTTFCGDWSGNIWNDASTYAGQEGGSCAAQTGYSTCAEYVLNAGDAFSEAYWEVSYVKYFQPK